MVVVPKFRAETDGVVLSITFHVLINRFCKCRITAQKLRTSCHHHMQMWQ